MHTVTETETVRGIHLALHRVAPALGISLKDYTLDSFDAEPCTGGTNYTASNGCQIFTCRGPHLTDAPGRISAEWWTQHKDSLRRGDPLVLPTLQEGKFPVWADFIGQAAPIKLAVDRVNLTRSVRAVNAMQHSRLKMFRRIDFTCGVGVLHASAPSTLTETVECSYCGNPEGVRFSLNAQALLNALRGWAPRYGEPMKRIEVSIGTTKEPVTIRGGAFTAAIMPMTT